MSKTEKRLQNLQDDIKEWSDNTFGSHRSGKPIAFHLKKEIDEVIEAIDVLHTSGNNKEAPWGERYGDICKAQTRVKFELADCLTLLLDVASHENINVSDLLDASEEKLEINKKRKWGEPDENGVVEHMPE